MSSIKMIHYQALPVLDGICMHPSYYMNPTNGMTLQIWFSIYVFSFFFTKLPYGTAVVESGGK